MEFIFSHRRVIVKQVNGLVSNICDEKVHHIQSDFFKRVRSKLPLRGIRDQDSLETHAKDARSMFTLLSSLSQTTKFDKDFVKRSIRFYKWDIRPEYMSSPRNHMTIFPDKFFISTRHDCLKFFFLDADFNDLAILFFNKLNFHNDIDDHEHQISTDKVEKIDHFCEFEYIAGIKDSLQPPDWDARFEEETKNFTDYMKAYNRKMHASSCLDILIKPIASRFDNLFYQPSLPRKRQRKDFIHPLKLDHKNFIISRIAERIAKDLAFVLREKEVKVIHIDLRFKCFFELMNKFDRFSNLGIELNDLHASATKRIVRETSIETFLSRPELFFDPGTIIH
jgi:hypothetical protein